ncbi:tRNA uridine-5-carboxymethylaminomethyl(34) synthesis GTPase MnmE [Hydrogenimonas thermophila]|uniref:tRNA uridine-5-carboxymethylaminomethyl(34) synthesis GTPase MnmE n=1 Tax=Hydrogenimonas thermophila TaxID=223786 RepID=UPI0029370CBF|nr:tRNA uridine-5-carboxymethylaminomethyl(34) synthesis GTPase MnmE [Hydrogenimonas thermophila]WOE68748.1 tRNA uridine-5-carboxymethylaminomethyl(34) synthesis GTPase MnmE [Hydrogenimonas thermophila]WOE71258.1 tRNA uridine-5-carboxymethylaminomethyl(34) synthesis GTPase MnmE [Hydrogenimonas thermophila]
MSDTIAAVATASGVGSVAIVRVSGDNALDITKKVTKRETFSPRYAHLSSLYNQNDELIDEAIVIWFKAPHSFTTEDVVEFQCHGGSIVAEKILETVLFYGARLAEPGEFTRRAFLGGRIDLTEAEAIAKLIEAKSDEAAKILARQMKGELREFVDDVREKLLRAVAFAEVTIDYAEEDLPDDIVDNILHQLEEIELKIGQIVSSSERRRGMIEGFKVSIVGKPNVGKSSLLNAMLGYKRAIVSDIAGTTRDTIEEQIRVGSHLIRIIDTAGIRDSSDTIEKIGIERSVEAIEQSDIVIAIFDVSRAWDEEDEQILSLLEKSGNNKEIIVALNKIDLPKKLTTKKLEQFNPLQLSQDNKAEQIFSELEKRLSQMSQGDELLLISARQIEAVKQARSAISQAKEPLLMGELEIFTFHLNDAISAISSISKPVDFNDIMDKMFGEFCLGK